MPSADTSLAGSPTILNRQISTSLTLRDGGSLLMGGLISGNQGAGATGVPVLGQLPVLGRLFRTDAVQADRTELIFMVTPYVIADHEEGWVRIHRIGSNSTCTPRFSNDFGPRWVSRCPRTGGRFRTSDWRCGPGMEDSCPGQLPAPTPYHGAAPLPASW